MSEQRKIPVAALRTFVMQTWMDLGVPVGDAEICTDVLLTADLFGIASHGISRFKYYCDRIQDGIQSPVTETALVNDAGTTAVLDGQNGMGQVIAHQAMSLAIDKACQHGMGCVVVRNSSHFGIAGYYSLMAVERDAIGITFTNARPAVAPTHSCEPVLGTNPYAIGIPSDGEFPFLIDCATSVMQRGNFEVLERQVDHVEVRDSVTFCENQVDACHPSEVLEQLTSGQAALRTIGDHKGYGLSVAIELFCSALQSGDYLKQLNGYYEGGPRAPYNVGHMFLAMNPASFLGMSDFKENVGNVLRQLQESRPVGGTPVMVAGQKEYESRREVMKTGIPVDPALLQELQSLGFSLEV